MKKKKFPKDCKPTGKRYSSVKELCKDTGFDLEKYTNKDDVPEPEEKPWLRFDPGFVYANIQKTGWDMVIGDNSIRLINIKPLNWFHRTMQRLILGFKWVRNGDKPE